MKALIVTPAPEGSLTGNRRTAERWAGILSTLQHGVQIVQQFQGQPCDLLIALHALKSSGSIERFHAQRPGAPLVVALTGTDLYHDLPTSETARRSLERATRLIALHHLAGEDLPEALRSKLRVILQSSEPPGDAPPRDDDAFGICVVGHLRPVKDPFRAAEAVRSLPQDSRVRVTHAGGALQPEMGRRARQEQAANPRYRWVGLLPRAEALRLVARSRLLVLSSEMEGGANVIGEAVVRGVPVLASRIAGSIGLLGADYPGYFPTGDTEALASLIRRCEAEPSFYEELRSRCRALAPDFSPERERAAWSRLLAELFPPPGPPVLE